MMKCPFCDNEIDTALFMSDSDEDLGMDEFMCPVCGRVLFKNETDATNFLRGMEAGDE